MAQEIITLENLAAEIAKLRGELATWKALAIKQDRLSTAQMLAVNSGATAGKIAQIATNTSDIAALQQIASSAFRVVKVAQLPASGEPYIMYLVPQTDGETLNYCNEYLWIDNAWELVGTTGAMANNGELQIIVNGVTVGTFTANQATDSTASITVPTDTSQLTNGAGYVDATALATALASKQDSLSLAQLAAVNSGITSTDVAQIGANTTAIAGKQDALTTSQLAAVNSGITSADVTQIGTNTGNIATNSAAIISLQGSKQNTLSAAQLLAVNSGITSSLVTQIGTNQSDITTLNTALGQSLTPSADDTYSLGGASFRYANIYAVNFTGDLTGTASKAIADEDGTSIKTGYGKLAGNQTWTGSNTFSQSIISNSGLWAKFTNLQAKDQSSLTSSQVKKIGVDSSDGKSFTKSEFIVASTYTRTAFCVNYYNTSGTIAYDFVINQDVDNQGNKSFYPSVSGTSKLGTSSYQWSAVYAQTYYYGTTAWGLDQANTWTGNNTFSSTIYSKIDATTLASFKDIYQCQNDAGNRVVTFRITHSTASRSLSINVHDNNNSAPKGITISNDGSNNINLSAAGTTNSLGTSTNKWKTLNGVNPGALSLPDMGSYLDFSSSITNFDGTHNFYTPPVDGWMTVVTAGTALDLFEDNGQNDPRYQGSGASSTAVQGYCFCTIPVHKNVRVRIRVIGTSVYMAHVRPCLGNV